MKRGPLLLKLLFIALVAGSFLWLRKPARGPNIIFILVDTLRPDYLGCYGFQGDISPTIDAMAAESVLFTHCISAAPRTEPSIATLFTSLNVESHLLGSPRGVFSKNSPVLPDGTSTLAGRLRKAGYQTAGFVGNFRVDSKFGFGQGFDVYQYAGTEARGITDRALTWLNRGRDAGKPFFLYLHYMDVHGPYRAQERDFALLKNSPSLGEDRALTDGEKERLPGYLGTDIKWKTKKQAATLGFWKGSYAAGVRGFDRQLSFLIEKLKDKGYWDNSIVVLTADHGEAFLEHGQWDHGKTLYNELLRVPLLIHLPDSDGKGQIVDHSVGLIDIMPTLLKQAGASTTFLRLQGRDISPLLEGGVKGGSRWIFSSGAFTKPGQTAIQDQNTKLIFDKKEEASETFDLKADPQEQKDISYSAPQIKKDLRSRILKHLKGTKPRLRTQSVPLSDKEIEALKSLGYLQ